MASTNVQAAYEAILGSTGSVRDAALFTDGVTRLVDWFSAIWQEVLAALQHQRSAALIRCVCEVERAAPPPHGKASR